MTGPPRPLGGQEGGVIRDDWPSLAVAARLGVCGFDASERMLATHRYQLQTVDPLGAGTTMK